MKLGKEIKWQQKSEWARSFVVGVVVVVIALSLLLTDHSMATIYTTMVVCVCKLAFH